MKKYIVSLALLAAVNGHAAPQKLTGAELNKAIEQLVKNPGNAAQLVPLLEQVIADVATQSNTGVLKDRSALFDKYTNLFIHTICKDEFFCVLKYKIAYGIQKSRYAALIANDPLIAELKKRAGIPTAAPEAPSARSSQDGFDADWGNFGPSR